MTLRSSRGSGFQSCESLLAHLLITSVPFILFFRQELEEPLRNKSLSKQAEKTNFPCTDESKLNVKSYKTHDLTKRCIVATITSKQISL